MAKTKVSNVLFQENKLYLSISQGLYILNPPSGWGFDKPEVQIPTLPPMCPGEGGGSGSGACHRQVHNKPIINKIINK